MTASAPKAIVVFDIDGVVRDVSQSYRRALADTVEHYTQGQYRPSPDDIDRLKAEGRWNNDWVGSQELTYRYWESVGQPRAEVAINYDELVDFFQRRYRGHNLNDPNQWDGYISQEPLLMSKTYLEQLTAAGYPWGFFSGATPGSARYVLEQRLHLVDPPLVAMGDAPDKPDPTGLLQVVHMIEQRLALPDQLPVFYAGDTVADLLTVTHAQAQFPQRQWIGIGVLPPHVQNTLDRKTAYRDLLQRSGASAIVDNITHLNPDCLGAVMPSA